MARFSLPSLCLPFLMKHGQRLLQVTSSRNPRTASQAAWLRAEGQALKFCSPGASRADPGPSMDVQHSSLFPSPIPAHSVDITSTSRHHHAALIVYQLCMRYVLGIFSGACVQERRHEKLAVDAIPDGAIGGKPDQHQSCDNYYCHPRQDRRRDVLTKSYQCSCED